MSAAAVREPVDAAGGPGVGTAIPGVEELLPPGERLLWVGAPNRDRLARQAMHVRGLAVYFLALLLAPALFAPEGASPLAAVVAGALWLLPLGASVVAFAGVLATLTARTTVYAITDRRVVMKVGVALPVTVNIPLDAIESVDVLARPDGGGDVALTLGDGVRVAYLILWPHARPWQFSRPRPAFRAVDGVGEVARHLRHALGAPAAAPVAARPPVAARVAALGPAR